MIYIVSLLSSFPSWPGNKGFLLYSTLDCCCLFFIIFLQLSMNLHLFVYVVKGGDTVTGGNDKDLVALGFGRQTQQENV